MLGWTDGQTKLESRKVKPAPFRYVLAQSLDEAVEALSEDSEARALSGGQSLVPLMNLRLARPATLVDLNRLDELSGVQVSDETVRLGALCRHRVLEHDPVIRRELPLLADAARYVGHPQVRARGTIGGTCAHADPAAELSACLVALGAQIELTGLAGRRMVDASDFFIGYMTPALEPGELVTAIEAPRIRPGTGFGFAEHAHGHGEYAFAGIAVKIVRNGVCDEVRAAVLSLSSRTLDVSVCLEPLIGRENLDDRALVEMQDRLDSSIEPFDDMHASAEYRRESARRVVEMAVHSAWTTAGANS